MRTLYLDCGMGAAGDMLTAALLELYPEPEKFVGQLNALGIPNVTFEVEKSARCGVAGTLMHVKVGGEEEASEDFTHEPSQERHHEEDHEHHGETHGNNPEFHHGLAHDGELAHHEHSQCEERCHHHHEHSEQHEAHSHGHINGEHSGLHHEHHHEHRSMADIEKIIAALNAPASVKQNALAVYKLIAEAEGQVHGRPSAEVHFHEVGTFDAIADVTAVCLLLHELAPERIVASPVCTGFGQVKCAHGILPVPAPATALLLKEVQTYGGSIQGELCTPTGAALLKHFASSFESQPAMRTEKIGYGLGKKAFPAANCVRALLGEAEPTGSVDEVLELKCNLDDMTAEALSFAAEELLAAGALDVFTTAIGMKKNRPATLLTCLCRPEARSQMLALIFRHTTTLGVRETLCRRSILKRETKVVSTELGNVRVKCGSGCGVRRAKIEYDDLAKIARENNLPLAEAEQTVKASAAFKALGGEPQ